MALRPRSRKSTDATFIALPSVTTAEFNAMLAGLRALQFLMDRDALPPAIRSILRDGQTALNADQLDHLAHRLNCG